MTRVFFLFTHHGFYAELINFDNELFTNMLKKFNYFWYKFIVADILASNNMNVDSSSSSRAQTPMITLFNQKGKKGKAKKDLGTDPVCGTCLKVVEEITPNPADYGIQCEMCLMWSHINCVNVSEEQFNNDKFTWLCESCPAIDFQVN